jgi:hypothetical protein
MHSIIDQKFPNNAQITGEAEGLTIDVSDNINRLDSPKVYQLCNFKAIGMEIPPNDNIISDYIN